MNRKNSLRALKNLCAFIGAIALFSYFANWAVDLRHWYVTLASFLMCSILWLGFYVIEVRGGVTQIAVGLSTLRKSKELSWAKCRASRVASRYATCDNDSLPWVKRT